MGKRTICTMTLNLSEREMKILTQMATDKQMTKTQIMRQALRVYQSVSEKMNDGAQFVLIDKDGNRVLPLGLGYIE